MVHVQSGKLNRRVAIRRPQISTTVSGAAEIDWAPEVQTVWASITPLQGRELAVAQQINAEVTHAIKMRYRQDIKTSDRLLFENREFEITQILDVEEAKTLLRIIAIERSPAR